MSRLGGCGAAGLLLLSGCIRPSDNYETKVHSAGTALDAVEEAPQEMGGAIEYARFRLFGTNLGFGTTFFFGDAPRADGLAFTLGYAYFGYPKDEAFDRTSSFVSPGPSIRGKDRCATRVRAVGYVGLSEYVDVGDHIALTADNGDRIVLERDPSAHPNPAGESFFAGYGGVTLPVVENHDLLPDTWRPGSDWDVTWPGTVVPPTATMGSVPYPLERARLRLPDDIVGLRVNGERVRAPVHQARYSFEPENECILEDRYRDDDVRFAGPWEQDMEVSWTPSPSREPLTLLVRYLGEDIEGACPFATDAECGPGFHCTADRTCLPDEGSNSIVLAEVACTVVDDGAFTMTAADLAGIDEWLSPGQVKGATLVVARISEDTTKVPDVLTHNGKRVEISPVRLRAIDAIHTRLGWPTVAESAGGRR